MRRDKRRVVPKKLGEKKRGGFVPRERKKRNASPIGPRGKNYKKGEGPFFEEETGGEGEGSLLFAKKKGKAKASALSPGPGGQPRKEKSEYCPDGRENLWPKRGKSDPVFLRGGEGPRKFSRKGVKKWQGVVSRQGLPGAQAFFLSPESLVPMGERRGDDPRNPVFAKREGKKKGGSVFPSQRKKRKCRPSPSPIGSQKGKKVLEGKKTVECCSSP